MSSDFLKKSIILRGNGMCECFLTADYRRNPQRFVSKSTQSRQPMREIVKVADEVRLIDVAIGRRDIGQLWRFLSRRVLQAVQHGTKAADAHVQLRRDSDPVQEQPFELSLTEITRHGKVADS